MPLWLAILAVVGGTFLVLLVLADVFQAAVVPRRIEGFRFRFSARFIRRAWPLWADAGVRLRDVDRREDALGAFGPFMVICLLGLWGLNCILGFGLIFYGLGAGLRPTPNLGDATYFAGTAFLTIGFGDIVPTSGMTRFIALLAGASGFSIVAIVTAFLFSVVGSFQARENFVVTFGRRAGAPPSGVTLLETYAKLDIEADLDTVFEDGMRWAAAVLEAHLAYPILGFFRSTHTYESWIASLGALLDASTLYLTLIDDAKRGHARLFSEMGRHCVGGLADYFEFETTPLPGIERAEFDVARQRLAIAGLAVRDDDGAWDEFVALRSTYAPALNVMARYFRIPPALWVGDRSPLPSPARPRVPLPADHVPTR